jgi:hypothetical protein
MVIFTLCFGKLLFTLCFRSLFLQTPKKPHKNEYHSSLCILPKNPPKKINNFIFILYIYYNQYLKQKATNQINKQLKCFLVQNEDFEYKKKIMQAQIEFIAKRMQIKEK